LHASERCFERAVNILPAVSAGIGIALLAAESELGGNHHTVAIATVFQEFANQGFAGAIGVTVGGVKPLRPRRTYSLIMTRL